MFVLHFTVAWLDTLCIGYAVLLFPLFTVKSMLSLWIVQLSTVSVEGRGVMPTQLLLCEHAEKLEAAKALYELHLE